MDAGFKSIREKLDATKLGLKDDIEKNNKNCKERVVQVEDNIKEVTGTVRVVQARANTWENGMYQLMTTSSSKESGSARTDSKWLLWKYYSVIEVRKIVFELLAQAGRSGEFIVRVLTDLTNRAFITTVVSPQRKKWNISYSRMTNPEAEKRLNIGLDDQTMHIDWMLAEHNRKDMDAIKEKFMAG
ncbi:hypothetical protein EV426DRAFT_100900 [Tirmania nivea]|nr:hypothetical protein EV426DRAFT_100900 [Tirmania nivea]